MAVASVAAAKNPRIALVTGGNRGLGLETCRQLGQAGHTVVLTARDEAQGRAAVQQLSREGLHPRFYPLDVTNAGSIAALIKLVEREFGRLDILINNAAVYLDGRDAQGGHSEQKSILEIEADLLRRTMETNVYGPLLLVQAAAPLLKKSACARVVNVSSGAGQLSSPRQFEPAYRISKTALNALTVIQAAHFQDAGIPVKVNCVCPGWCKTDMGGPRAPRDPVEGARGIVWAALLPDDAPTGQFFRDMQPIPW
ncbi:MAG TPA: SDR family oxidoreductase [Planctomycetota bacterium]|nr:SDR family oxidoreductase [Planctomycetota bacterium]